MGKRVIRTASFKQGLVLPLGVIYTWLLLRRLSRPLLLLAITVRILLAIREGILDRLISWVLLKLWLLVVVCYWLRHHITARILIRVLNRITSIHHWLRLIIHSRIMPPRIHNTCQSDLLPLPLLLIAHRQRPKLKPYLHPSPCLPLPQQLNLGLNSPLLQIPQNVNLIRGY